MPAFKGLSAVFALAATATLLTAGCALSVSQTKNPAPAADCKWEQAPEKPFQYITMTDQGRTFAVKPREGEEMSAEETQKAADLIKSLVQNGRIAIVPGSFSERNSYLSGRNSDPCGLPSLKFLVTKEAVADAEKNPNLNSGIIFDFNGSADNVDMPVIWLNSIESGLIVPAYQGAPPPVYQFKINDPLDQKTIDQIVKAQGFVLPSP